MIRFFDYYKDTFRYALQELNYNMTHEEGTANICFDDDIDIEKTDSGLIMVYTRRLYIKPEADPTLRIAYRILFDQKEKMDPNTLTCEEIYHAFYDNALDSLDTVAARMSLLVSEIMFTAFSDPIILPPTVIRAKELKEDS